MAPGAILTSLCCCKDALEEDDGLVPAGEVVIDFIPSLESDLDFLSSTLLSAVTRLWLGDTENLK